MKYTTIAILFLVSLFSSLVPACGDPETITLSGGDFAEDVMQEFCERGVSCGFIGGGDVDTCVDVAVNEICASADCSTSLTVDYSDYQDCLNAFDDFSCALLDAETFPSECNTIMEF
jgi:hypothetical protein